MHPYLIDCVSDIIKSIYGYFRLYNITIFQSIDNYLRIAYKISELYLCSIYNSRVFTPLYVIYTHQTIIDIFSIYK